MEVHFLNLLFYLIMIVQFLRLVITKTCLYLKYFKFKNIKFRQALSGPYANQPWYYGQLTREQSDVLLKAHGIEGDFLIRDSESNVCLIQFKLLNH